MFSAVSGEEVCRGFEFEGKVAKELKHSLTAQTGYSRFRQRLLKNDHRQIEDDEVLDAESLQLVFLEFCPSSAEQEKELLDACENSDLDKLERLLRQTPKSQRQYHATSCCCKTGVAWIVPDYCLKQKQKSISWQKVEGLCIWLRFMDMWKFFACC